MGVSKWEGDVADAFMERGWGVLKRGWPDLLAFHPDGRVKAVEVKAGVDALRDEQRQVIAILRSIGVDVEVWRRTESGDWFEEHESSGPSPRVAEVGQEVPSGLLRTRDYTDPGLLIEMGDLALLEEASEGYDNPHESAIEQFEALMARFREVAP